MTAKIIDRGRGPEIAGTRVTVYRILDFVRDGTLPEGIAAALNLTEDQLQLALDYVAAHQPEVEQEYEAILRRVNQANPSWVDAGRARTVEQLRERVQARQTKGVTHADSGRQ
jgi:uncharacterized protein (DUF433 family)